MRTLGFLRRVPGLFMAGMLAASLSSLSLLIADSTTDGNEDAGFPKRSARFIYGWHARGLSQLSLSLLIADSTTDGNEDAGFPKRSARFIYGWHARGLSQLSLFWDKCHSCSHPERRCGISLSIQNEDEDKGCACHENS